MGVSIDFLVRKSEFFFEILYLDVQGWLGVSHRQVHWISATWTSLKAVGIIFRTWQNLKEELAVSQQKRDRYAHLRASPRQISRIQLVSFTVEYKVLQAIFVTLLNLYCPPFLRPGLLPGTRDYWRTSLRVLVDRWSLLLKREKPAGILLRRTLMRSVWVRQSCAILRQWVCGFWLSWATRRAGRLVSIEQKSKSSRSFADNPVVELVHTLRTLLDITR